VSAVVGLDTATGATSVAVLVQGGREVERRDDPGPGERPRHAEVLQTLLEQALEQAGVGWDAVGRICVGTGPGGFTGLRLGIATARALAQGHDLPVVGVSSLEALARGIELVGSKELDLPGHPDMHGPVLAMIDARRGEVFAAS
jgi:tRNA threonylcarbamoyladenosine biosynthesis protein TsaB